MNGCTLSPPITNEFCSTTNHSDAVLLRPHKRTPSTFVPGVLVKVSHQTTAKQTDCPGRVCRQRVRPLRKVNVHRSEVAKNFATKMRDLYCIATKKTVSGLTLGIFMSFRLASSCVMRLGAPSRPSKCKEKAPSRYARGCTQSCCFKLRLLD